MSARTGWWINLLSPNGEQLYSRPRCKPRREEAEGVVVEPRASAVQMQFSPRQPEPQVQVLGGIRWTDTVAWPRTRNDHGRAVATRGERLLSSDRGIVSAVTVRLPAGRGHPSATFPSAQLAFITRSWLMESLSLEETTESATETTTEATYTLASHRLS